jgi:hypothetical protein
MSDTNVFENLDGVVDTPEPTYVGVLYKDVIIAKGKNYTDHIGEKEVELTEEQYEAIPIPCKLIDGEFVPSEFPEGERHEVEPTTEELLNIILGVEE